MCMGAERAGSPRQEETLESDLAKEPKIPSLLGAQPSHGFGVTAAAARAPACAFTSYLTTLAHTGKYVSGG